MRASVFVLQKRCIDHDPDYREEPERRSEERRVQRQTDRHPVDQHRDEERHSQRYQGRLLRRHPDARQQDEQHYYRDGGHQRRERQTVRDRIVDLLVHQPLPPWIPRSKSARAKNRPFSHEPVNIRHASMALLGVRCKFSGGLR